MSIPPDFPRLGYGCASISGVQPKLAVRLVNGQFISGLTADELAARYDICVDLVQQLTAYCARKIAGTPNLNIEDLLTKVRTASASKGWDVTKAELDWILFKVKFGLEGPLGPGAL